MSERWVPFPAERERRVALPTGWGVRTAAAEARGGSLLAEWRIHWEEERGELARRISGIERCLAGLSRTEPSAPRLTVFEPTAFPAVVAPAETAAAQGG